MTKKLKCLVTVLSVLLMAEVACGMTWKPKLEDSPTLHATAINIKVKLKSPVPAKIVISLLTMEYYNIYHKDTNDKGVFWQAEVMTNGNEIVETILNQQDFKYVYKDRTLISPCRIANTYQVDVTTDGVKDDGIAGVEVSWINDDKTVFPWETDPAPLTETGGVTWWPGVSTNNAGHFGYRYEPNGLLIDNVGFGCIETSWYYFKNAANEPFQFNFKIPESLEPNKQFIIKSDTDAKTGEVINRTGEGRQTEYKVDKGIYGKDMIDADWTSMRWKRNVRTKAGKEYWQELRYSILAPGIQVETNSPEFILSFQEGKGEKAPAAVVWMSNKGLVVTAGDQVNPALMRENWLVLLAEDGTPEIPVMVVFQHRPEHLKWRSDGMVVQRGKGVGTLAIGRPFGVKVQETNTRALWGKNPHLISGQSFKQFAELLMAYAWTCKESFSVSAGWVAIKNDVSFLPWQDDWNNRPRVYSPLPPLISYSIMRGLLPKTCCLSVRKDFNLDTKWGPYWAAAGKTVEYKLPLPRMLDYFPLQVGKTAHNQEIYARLMQVMSDDFALRFSGVLKDPQAANLAEPGMFPHYAAHDFVAGMWRAANFLTPDLREKFRQANNIQVRNALFTTNYRYRKDPITGAQYLACTMWGAGSGYAINDENGGDIDYWQGLTLYGLYTQAKYSGNWALMRENWPVIRSLISYWTSTHSWVFMAPGARESGEFFGGDMMAAGYDGLVGYYKLTRQLGTPYQQDLAAYLVSKGAVSQAAVFGFRAWCDRMSHQERKWGGRVTAGFGERFVASIKVSNNETRDDYSARDPWWMTGPIGPQGAQPELLDLAMERCPQDILNWETVFREMCPDKGFLTHDSGRVMPHMMLRMYLNDTLRKNAWDCLGEYKAYLARDVHTVASLLAWDVPVRLEEWAPAYIEAGRWDELKRTAHLSIDAGKSPARIRLAVKTDHPGIVLDGKTAPFTLTGHADSWAFIAVEIPSGKHLLDIAIK